MRLQTDPRVVDATAVAGRAAGILNRWKGLHVNVSKFAKLLEKAAALIDARV